VPSSSHDGTSYETARAVTQRGWAGVSGVTLWVSPEVRVVTKYVRLEGAA